MAGWIQRPILDHPSNVLLQCLSIGPFRKGEHLSGLRPLFRDERISGTGPMLVLRPRASPPLMRHAHEAADDPALGEWFRAGVEAQGEAA